jgi:hypothetical protein
MEEVRLPEITLAGSPSVRLAVRPARGPSHSPSVRLAGRATRRPSGSRAEPLAVQRLTGH